MRVGVNYPWYDYGWDFGPGPADWRGAWNTPRWYAEIDDHLRTFGDLGVTVLRWFILADGLSYGTGAAAPVPDRWRRGRWRFDPPPLDSAVLDHFAELLERFAATAGADGRPAIQLLPVLADFHFCGPGAEPGSLAGSGWVKGGRADAIADRECRSRFLDRVLDPLLDVSRRRADRIYAWELINEPEWVTGRWRFNPAARPPVTESAMLAFLEEGHARVRAAGLTTTVGFASRETIHRWGVAADIPQFHHYPEGRRTLARHADSRRPAIVGEFSTVETDVWPELPDADQSVLSRLRHARAQGFALAMPWSFRGRDRHTAWSRDVMHGIRMFTRET